MANRMNRWNQFAGYIVDVAGLILGNERTVLTTPDVMVQSDTMVAVALTAPGAVSLTLAADMGVGQTVRIRDKTLDAATNNITINAPSGCTIDGAATVVVNANGGSIHIRRDSTTTFHVMSRNWTAGSGLAVNADIPMASHKLTGLSAGSANGDSLRYEQGGLPVFANATGAIGAATRFPTTAGGPGSALEVAVGLVTRTGILRNLYASLVTAPGGTDTVAFTVRKSSDNGATWSSTTLTCTITGTAKGASDTTHAPAVTAGDLLSVQMVSSAGTAATPAIAFEVL